MRLALCAVTWPITCVAGPPSSHTVKVAFLWSLANVELAIRLLPALASEDAKPSLERNGFWISKPGVRPKLGSLSGARVWSRAEERWTTLARGRVGCVGRGWLGTSLTLDNLSALPLPNLAFGLPRLNDDCLCSISLLHFPMSGSSRSSVTLGQSFSAKCEGIYDCWASVGLGVIPLRNVEKKAGPTTKGD